MTSKILFVVIVFLVVMVILLSIRITKMTRTISEYSNKPQVGNLTILYPPDDWNEPPYIQLEVFEGMSGYLNTDDFVKLGINRIRPTEEELQRIAN